MDPVPYEIREEDIDEVLSAHEPVDGRDWPEEERKRAREHVMRNVTDLDDTVRTAAEDDSHGVQGQPNRAGSIADRPGDRAPARRDMALAAIEDLLIRDGFIDLAEGETRAFPVTTEPDSERND